MACPYIRQKQIRSEPSRIDKRYLIFCTILGLLSPHKEDIWRGIIAQLISPDRDMWIRMRVHTKQIQLKETEVWRLTEVERERESHGMNQVYLPIYLDLRKLRYENNFLKSYFIFSFQLPSIARVHANNSHRTDSLLEK